MAPPERCSQRPPRWPCLQKPHPCTAPRPNFGDDRCLADRPGPGEKKPSQGKKKKNPPAGVSLFYIGFLPNYTPPARRKKITLNSHAHTHTHSKHTTHSATLLTTPPLSANSSRYPTTTSSPLTMAPRERCSQSPPRWPCLQKPRPCAAPHPNFGDDRRLADRPGPGKKKPSRGKKKNPPAGVFLFYISFLPNYTPPARRKKISIEQPCAHTHTFQTHLPFSYPANNPPLSANSSRYPPPQPALAP